jgi:hypothetical protein
MKVTAQIPDSLYQAMVDQAQLRYGRQDLNQVLQEAIALWLGYEGDRVAFERQLNNLAYQRLKTTLQTEHLGQYVVIAYGQIQGIAAEREALIHLAPNAHHRLLFEVKADQAREQVRLWRIQRP